MTRLLSSAFLLSLAAAAAAQADTGDARTLAAAIDRFGSALAVRAETGGNLCQSPASVAFALLMTLPGARGDTAAELRKLLAPEGWDDARTLAATQVLLARLRGARKIELSVVGDLWPQAGHPLLPAFVAATRRTFDAEVRTVDYLRDVVAARRTINEQVARATHDRITGLVGPEVTRDTRLVLTDVIWLEADWRNRFEGYDTHDGAFHLAGGSEVAVPLMHRGGAYEVAEVDGVQVLRLPYADPGFAFDVALPPSGGSLAAAEAVLADAPRWRAALEVQAVSVTLPRFRVADSFRLVDTLRAMGLRLATGGNADFTGIDGGAGQLYIGEVVHKTFLDVAERGTEAAAATAVEIKDTGGPPARTFTADRPFAFALRDLDTGLVLFAGRVADPRPHKT